MLFNSYEYFLFFPLIVVLYFMCPKKARYILLCVASVFFYGCWNVKYVALLMAVIIVTYLSGIALQHYHGNQHRKKQIVGVTVTICLVLLSYFKYFGFILDNMNKGLSLLGKPGFHIMSSVILPVGISFYIFQALSYTIDVYREETEVEYNFVKYTLFVSFFPQLVAGPIERSKNLLKQVNEVPLTVKLDYDRIVNGLMLMLYGYFQKMVIADRLALIVNAVFNSWENINSGALFLGAISFTLEIYCDFASYSAIAIGSAQIMGFELMENFNVPYFSSSIKEFWSRWHISLSSYLRDYLYIPLGGNRCSKGRRYFNLLFTFFVSGIWHGAAWNYIIWGALHGILRVGEELIGSLLKRLKLHINKFIVVLKVLITNFLVMIAWILFRADSFSLAKAYILKMFRFTSEGNFWVAVFTMEIPEIVALFIAILFLIFVDCVKFFRNQRIDLFLQKTGLPIRWLILLFMIGMIYVFGVYGVSVEVEPFIYFQF